MTRDPLTGGFVVTHPTKRNSYEIVIDLNRPFEGPNTLRTNICPTCHAIHHHKAYHILLNGDGRAVVSPGVFQGLKRAKAFGDPKGLAVEAHTTKPPKQTLGTKGGMMGLVPTRDEVTIYHS